MPSDSKLLLKTPKSPIPLKAGILLVGPENGKCSLEIECWLHGCLALGAADLEAFPLETWFRCLVLTGVSRANQHAFMTDILGERVVFPEEILTEKLKDGSTLSVVPFNIKLAESLKIARKPGTYHIQSACLAHRSNLFEIECG